ncbi:hydantoinase/oxoprolinase family protein [Spiractinospora alimapuensis]|uniref:hydantoinase/oxoprolinase family protein n=1 Tax=Spiractinospora alimapuensis TaxID=2820884 RepID=UPI001F1CE8D8|nr:hydantoinase/oxoprolinase family protein [Spiractinospora alimapuensis]QVQ54155.1 hydantoinase/oxoprolinase family protein [Spiractinospora alimapuensis]
MATRIGIDTGGTFTDLVVAEDDRVKVAAKSLTTHGDLAAGLLNSLGKAEVDADAVQQIVHGTTVALNAILTRRGAEIGLITTDGFRDLLDMGRGWRSADALLDPRWRRPHELRPIVERYRRRTVRERIQANGDILVPLDEEGLLREVEDLRADGCRSIAVCFLHSYKHPEHEQRAAKLIRDRFPDLGVSVSSEVAPFPREYNRLSTSVLNAYAQPMMADYTRSIERRLSDAGHRAPLMFMTNDGGLSTPDTVSSIPVTTLNSGPVGGVMGVQTYSRLLNTPNLVGFDMGGTSTDVAVVADGRASTKRELELEHDLIVSMPVLEIHSIGAGGGSIAALDAAGGLNVGPESAGSNPGPACYGRGGELPTVTDALLLLGWLAPDNPLGGEIRPDVAAAEQAYGRLAETLGAEPREVASTVAEVAIHRMAEAIRQLTVYRGVDPREFSLLAYGAAGPFAATQVARVLEMPRVVFPALAGVFSAFGLLEGAGFEEEVSPVMALASEELVADAFARMRETAARLEGNLGGDTETLHAEFVVDAMYAGQRWELPAFVDPTRTDALAHLTEAFNAAHHRQFGYSLPAPLHISSVRVRVVSTADRTVRPQALTPKADAAPRTHRTIVIGGVEHDGAAVYRADEFAPGQVVHGPAVIEAASYTGVLDAGDVARVNEVGDVIVELKEAKRS